MNQLKKCRYGRMLYQDNDKYVGKSFGYYGEFSEGEVALLRAVLKPHMTFIDVGANIGGLTIPAAKLVPQGHVFAYEPQRVLYQTLCGNVSINDLKNVTCVQAAVGGTSGTINVPELEYTSEQNFGSLDLRHKYNGMSTPVQLIRLDDVGFKQCAFIKIDVEGMEIQVVSGAIELISATRPYLYLDDDQESMRAALRSTIRAAGYRIYDHWPLLFNSDNYFLNPKNIWQDADKILISRNIFCVPAERENPINTDEFGMREDK